MIDMQSGCLEDDQMDYVQISGPLDNHLGTGLHDLNSPYKRWPQWLDTKKMSKYIEDMTEAPAKNPWFSFFNRNMMCK